MEIKNHNVLGRTQMAKQVGQPMFHESSIYWKQKKERKCQDFNQFGPLPDELFRPLTSVIGCCQDQTNCALMCHSGLSKSQFVGTD